ncbi:unnamed protein product [Adineta steineri]|uniref:DAGKc domain-containing protein n=1 Tax=Adineta steineri TaxID=433720 RepID=A0A814J3C8_9BILA|nr:unnamed protein product [Adineta steineri]CAF1100187.1 unnamed protein product [Adineta steineri]
MSSILFLTSCYIAGKLCYLRIYIDNDSNDLSLSTIDDLLSILDTCESILNATNILSSIRLHFELLIDKNKNSIHSNDNTIPETIFLNKLLNIKQTVKLSNTSNSSSKAQHFEQFSSQQISENYGMIPLESTQVDLSYINISKSFIWTVQRIQIEMSSIDAYQLHLVVTRYLSKLKHRPRHLLVFINPQCGKGKGRSVYEKKVLPLFEEANISVDTIYTERANHARDYINEHMSLDNYDGLICVGGDGIFSELCHSLLLKTARQAGLNMDDSKIDIKRPELRIGIIPAGSTDAVTFGTTGHNDPITSTLQIITGESLLIDIVTVHSERGFVCFMATMLAYGFFGNIIRQSDNWRLFGPLRYNLAGFFQFLRNTSYHTELIITEPLEKYDSKALINNLNRHLFGNTMKWQETIGEKSDSEESSVPLVIKREGQYRTINCLNMPCRCEKSKYGMSPSVHLGDGSFDIILVKRSWRMGLFRFLRHVANDARTIEELSNVERYRATEVIIRPVITQQKEIGNWACDGEVITANEVRIRAHHRVLNLFASGICSEQIKKINKK